MGANVSDRLTPADIAAIVEALKVALLPVSVEVVADDPVDGTGTGNDPWGPA